MQSTSILTDSDMQFLADVTKKLVAFGQFGNGPRLTPQQSARTLVDRMDAAEIERITDRLIENFALGVYYSPEGFSDKELAVISTWGGLDEKGTFGHLDGETPDPKFRSSDDRLIAEYQLDVSAGENTWPNFAAILKSRKATWAKSHPKKAAKLRARQTLEEAIEQCMIAGVSQRSVMAQAQELSDYIYPFHL